MKKIIYIISMLFTGVVMNAQTGIGTTDPKSSLDVFGKPTDATAIDGIQAPRLTRAELTAKGNVLYGTDQKGVLIYITDVSGGDNLSQRINITNVGYYYFDGVVWRRWLNPTNAPVAGYALLTDSSGNTSWGSVTPSTSTLATIALTGNPTSYSVATGAAPGAMTDLRFFQAFNTTVTDPNGVFNVSTGTYTAAQSGNYMISATIVPNAAPQNNINGYSYPINLEVRKNCTLGVPNSGTIIMDASTIRYATPSSSTTRFSVGISGMVTLNAGDKLNLVVYLGGPNATDLINGGISFPSYFSYASIADYKAIFSVTAL